jgi:hypothetical protein
LAPQSKVFYVAKDDNLHDKLALEDTLRREFAARALAERLMRSNALSKKLANTGEYDKSLVLELTDSALIYKYSENAPKGLLTD